MRIIKFRGWHTIQNKMYSAETMADDQLTLLPTGNFINVNGQSTKLSTIFPQDKFIPLQFTGLKDKNGKEIYEGDIVHCFNIPPDCAQFSSCQGQVIWDDKGCDYNIVNKNGDFLLAFGLNHSEYEVIGNIYENPELLEVPNAKP